MNVGWIDASIDAVLRNVEPMRVAMPDATAGTTKTSAAAAERR